MQQKKHTPMKKVITILFLASINLSYGQLISGEIVDINRPLLTQTDFTIKGSKEGIIVYDLTVDLEGNVTSETLVPSMTTVSSTPTKMEVKNYLKSFKFQNCVGCPQFHHVRVKISVVTK